MTTAARIAKNEALFREVNERIRELAEASAEKRSELVDFVCECSRDECTDSVALTLAEYEAVRTEPTHFAVAPEHVTGDAEHVHAEYERYWVVEKEGAAGELAEDLDGA
jgi:hypothetical protein